MARIRVLLVDDHAIVREGIRMLLETAADITVVGEAGNGRQAVLLAGQLRPDVVLLELVMPQLNGPGSGATDSQAAAQHQSAGAFFL